MVRVSPIGFGSAFMLTKRIHNVDCDEEFGNVVQKLNENNIPVKVTEIPNYTWTLTYPKLQGGRPAAKEARFYVRDEADPLVEKLCEKNHVDFVKQSTDELMKPESILSRVKPAPLGKQILLIDDKALERCSDRGLYETGYEGFDGQYHYHKNQLDNVLKSGTEIEVPTLIITYKDNMPDLIAGEKVTGQKKLFKVLSDPNTPNPDDRDISFNLYASGQTSEDNRLIYFAMKGNGMDKIPVYASPETAGIAAILGISADADAKK